MTTATEITKFEREWVNNALASEHGDVERLVRWVGRNMRIPRPVAREWINRVLASN